MGEILQPTDGLRHPVFRGKDDLCGQVFYQTTLAGDSKFCGEITADMGDDFHCGLFHKAASNLLFGGILTAK